MGTIFCHSTGRSRAWRVGLLTLVRPLVREPTTCPGSLHDQRHRRHADVTQFRRVLALARSSEINIYIYTRVPKLWKNSLLPAEYRHGLRSTMMSIVEEVHQLSFPLIFIGFRADCTDLSLRLRSETLL